MSHLFTIDHLIVYAFLIFTLAFGLYHGRGIKSVREYAVADKQYGVAIITFTLLATAMGGGTTIGAFTEISESGVVVFFADFSIIIGAIFLGLFVAKKFNNVKFKDAMTVADIIEIYYGKNLSIFTAFMGFICCIGELAAQIIALGLLFSTIFSLNYSLAVIACGSVLVVYSTFGGIKSVVMTDVVQFAALIIVVPLIAYFAYFGVIETYDIITEINNSIEEMLNKNNFNYICYFFVVALPFMWLYPAFVQRFLMVKNPQSISISLYWYAIILCVLHPLLLLATYSVNSILPDIAPDEILTAFIEQKVPHIMKGITIIGLLAAIMSTADSFLNAAGVLTVHNFLKPIFKEKIKNELQWMRIITLLIGTGAVIVAAQEIGFVKLIIAMSGIWGAFIGIPLVMALFELKVTKESFYTSIILSPLAYLYFNTYYGEYSYVAPLMAILFSFAGFMLTNIYQNKGLAFVKASEDEESYNSSISVYNLRTIVDNIIINLAPQNLLKWINEQVKAQGLNQWLFSVYFWFSLIISVPFWMQDISYFHMPAITLLIIVTGVLSIILILRDVWTEEALNYYPLYWYITITLCLPYINTVMFCMNQGSYYELGALLVSLMILSLLVDWISFFIVSILGISLGYLHFVLLIGEENVIGTVNYANPSNVLISVSLIITAIAMLFFRTKDNTIMDKLRTLEAFGGTMAHEVKTPLSSNQSSLSLVESIMDEEIKATTKDGVMTLKLSEDSYKIIRYAMELMKKSNKQGQQTTDMLLMSMKKGGELQGMKDQLSLKKCIDEALEEYCLDDEKLQQINIDMKNDIEFIGDKEHMKHVIFNLIKNAFKHGGSDIDIDIVIQDNKLIFRDNGMGIPADKLPKIFDDFYTGSNTGTGLGLSLCRKIMESIRGTIKCKSKEGAYTEFTLEIPPMTV